MKRLTPVLLILLMGLPLYVLSQVAPAGGPGTVPLVQQTATHLDTATLVLSTTTSNNTNTITPPAGQYVYVTGMDIENCASGSNVTAAAQTAITTTNLNGVQWQIGVGPLAGTCAPVPTNVGPTGLKSQNPGAAVTFVVPTFGTNQTLRLNVYYYFGY